MRDSLAFIPVKELARHVAREHNALGASAVTVDLCNAVAEAEVLGLRLVDVTPSKCRGVCVEGKELCPKAVRKALWAWRGCFRLRREGTFVWTAYSPESGRSYVRLGAMVRPEVAERFVAFGGEELGA